jgi:hypothetical protein
LEQSGGPTTVGLGCVASADVRPVGQVLREAHDQARPYQVVPFDGQRSARR